MSPLGVYLHWRSAFVHRSGLTTWLTNHLAQPKVSWTSYRHYFHSPFLTFRSHLQNLFESEAKSQHHWKQPCAECPTSVPSEKSIGSISVSPQDQPTAHRELGCHVAHPPNQPNAKVSGLGHAEPSCQLIGATGFTARHQLRGFSFLNRLLLAQDALMHARGNVKPAVRLLHVESWQPGLGMSVPWPTEIKVQKQGKVLRICFTDGQEFTYSAELLRVESPSADSQRKDHSGMQKVVSGRKHVGILAVEPVGNYALRIKFDDLHETGIYTWKFLYDLGQAKFSRSRSYLRHLQERGLSREPKRPRRALS